MRRRDFIKVIGGTAAWPFAARAQLQARMPVIGFLSARAPAPEGYVATAFRRGLREVGYDEGRNVAIEYRWAGGHNDRLPALAADLVGRQVAVIAAISGTPAALAAKGATTAIPIVFANGGDPMASGLVAALNRPTGNITGVTFFTTALASKRLQLIRELLPTATAIGYFVKPNNPAGESEARGAKAAARDLGLQLHMLPIDSESAFEAAFATLAQRHVGALLVGSDPFFGDSSDLLVKLAARHALPTMYFSREFIEAGGLISYGTRQTDAYRQAGIYAGKILQGTKPADLPILQPTKFELVANLKTVRALNLDMPVKLLVALDEVIE